MRRRLGALLVVGAAPWLIVPYPGSFDLVFAWGLVGTRNVHFVSLYDYLFVYTLGPTGLPNHLLAWPLGTLFYLGALANASLSIVGREDRRITAVLLVLAAAMSLRMWWGLSTVGSTTVPLGAALLLVTAWWFHADEFEGMIPGSRGD
jgi:uncharacterized protein (TIGR04206 family)